MKKTSFSKKDTLRRSRLKIQNADAKILDAANRSIKHGKVKEWLCLDQGEKRVQSSIACFEGRHLHNIVPGTKMNKILKAAAVRNAIAAVTSARLFRSFRT